MKKSCLTFLVLFFLSVLVHAQMSIAYKTKLNVDYTITSDVSSELFAFSGHKNFNILQISDGKLMLDKTFKDAGLSFDWAMEAGFNLPQNKLVVCSKKNAVGCVDITTGKKIWEVQSFKALESDDKAMKLCGNFVLISEKKERNNFTLTCLDINTGNILWTIENEKTKVLVDNLYNITSSGYIGIYNSAKKMNIFRLIDIKTGKVETTADIDGEIICGETNKDNSYYFIHHRISEEKAYLTAINLKDKKVQWKTKATNLSNNIMVINQEYSFHREYADIDCFDNKVLLSSYGVEAFDVETGKSLYSIPSTPYYYLGLNSDYDGIFKYMITGAGIFMADTSEKDIVLKMIDKSTGKVVWKTDKMKGKFAAPNAIINKGSITVQFGGLCYRDAGDKANFVTPYAVTTYDLATGKVLWNVDLKKDFYYITNAKENIEVVGKKDLLTLDVNTGTEVKNEKNPFEEDYYMTKVGFSKISYKRTATIDFSNRTMTKISNENILKINF